VPNRRNSWALQPGAAFRLSRNFNPDFEQPISRPILGVDLSEHAILADSALWSIFVACGPLRIFPATRQNRILREIFQFEAWILNVVSQFFIRQLGPF